MVLGHRYPGSPTPRRQQNQWQASDASKYISTTRIRSRGQGRSKTAKSVPTSCTPEKLGLLSNRSLRESRRRIDMDKALSRIIRRDKTRRTLDINLGNLEL